MNKELAKSIAAFQQEVPAIHESSKNDFAKYTYANLGAIFKVINPLLKKHNLGFTQIVNGTQLCTTIFHIETGETIESKMDIPQGVTLKGMNDFQILGSGLTYLRRYALSGMLGLVTDSDMDASGQQDRAKKLPAITQARFEKAMNAIENDGFSPDKLLATYSLNGDQNEVLEDVLKTMK